MAKKMFLLYPTTQEFFFPLYPTPQQNLMQCTVYQKNLPHGIQQCRRFSFVVSHNRRSFPPLWDTKEEFFFHFGIQRKRFFPLWDTMEKNYIQRIMIFLTFKCLSFSSNKNLGKICYLNSQTNPWKEVKVENYMVNYEKNIVSHCGIQRSRDFFKFLNINNFMKINFSAKRF
jgi:hypothetical protein